MVIEFRDLSKRHISSLWRQGANSDGWPKEFATFSHLEQYIQTGNLSAVLSRGQVKGIWLNGSLTGFATLHEIEQGFTGQDTGTFEGGTYLLPAFRGIGMNESIKRHLVSAAFHTYNATWCIFCIPVENQRAIRAMDKLPLTFLQITMADTHHSLFRYLKWKSWKTGKRFILYAIMNKKYT
jgi:RimJ/RimL family protein N-acetyltransferase